jgi:hypothetical protein
MNREVEELSKGENIVKWINGKRISWLGHLERMEEDRLPKKIFTQELEGTRRRGRLRKEWREEVERDLQVLGVRRCERVGDREGKMERYCSTGQSPQRAVAPTEEGEEVYFYSLRVSGSHVPIIRRINCINTTSGICHSV